MLAGYYLTDRIQTSWTAAEPYNAFHLFLVIGLAPVSVAIEPQCPLLGGVEIFRHSRINVVMWLFPSILNCSPVST